MARIASHTIEAISRNTPHTSVTIYLAQIGRNLPPRRAPICWDRKLPGQAPTSHTGTVTSNTMLKLDLQTDEGYLYTIDNQSDHLLGYQFG